MTAFVITFLYYTQKISRVCADNLLFCALCLFLRLSRIVLACCFFLFHLGNQLFGIRKFEIRASLIGTADKPCVLVILVALRNDAVGQCILFPQSAVGIFTGHLNREVLGVDNVVESLD